MTFNNHVSKLLDFVQEKQNPYALTVNASMHNLLTKQAVEQEVATHLLRCFENGEKVYHAYRQDIFAIKSRKMSTVISKRKLPRFTDQPQSTSVELVTEKITLKSKAVSEVQRNMDIIRE